VIGRKITFALTLFVATPVFSEDFQSDPTHVTSLAQVEALEGNSLGAAGAQPRILMPLHLISLRISRSGGQMRIMTHPTIVQSAMGIL
jgi:hypothetical protein